MPETVGFIGLGVMGKPMAKNLLKAGHRLVVHSRSRAPVDEVVAAGATAAASPADVARQTTIIITMLVDKSVSAVLPNADAWARGGILFLANLLLGWATVTLLASSARKMRLAEEGPAPSQRRSTRAIRQ